MCDDVHATVEELSREGVEFAHPVRDEGWGLLTAIRLPGGGELGLYEPKHPSPLAPAAERADRRIYGTITARFTRRACESRSASSRPSSGYSRSRSSANGSRPTLRARKPSASSSSHGR